MLTAALAIYGALLSTFLAWLEYRRDRPLAHIRYDDFAREGLIDVLVENRSDVDVIVRGARVLFGKGVKVTVGDAVRDVIASQLGRSTLVRSKHNCTVTFNLPDDPRGRRSYFALISWRRLSGLATRPYRWSPACRTRNSNAFPRAHSSGRFDGVGQPRCSDSSDPLFVDAHPS